MGQLLKKILKPVDDAFLEISPAISPVEERSSANTGFLIRVIWAYFFLLIFEGALRKWVLPGLAEPLLIIRDPLALFLIFKALQQGIWRPNPYVILMWGVTVLSLGITMIAGHGNYVVALYGLRITTIHFPLIFIIGTVFTRSDVLKIGEWLLYLNIAMTLLVGIQFFSPQSAWVNMGVGGDIAGSGFSGAAGYFRVPGTFSFTNGLSLFYGFTAAYIFYFWISQNVKINRILLFGSTLALFAAIPLSISRTVLFEIILSFLFLLCIAGRNPRIVKTLIPLAIVGVGLFFTLNNLFFFQTASTVFTERFTNASAAEGGLEGTLIDRFLGGMYGAVINEDASFVGLGLGMGTNAGAHIMTGKRAFLVSEGEWGRLTGEMGFILGMLVILIRIGLVMELFRKSWAAIKLRNVLPWMLMSFGTVVILQGQWAQPTALGFATLVGGLVIASFKEE